MNSLRYLDVCEGIFRVYVVLYVGTSLSAGWYPIHLVLHFAYIIPGYKMLTILQWLVMNEWMNEWKTEGREEGLSLILRIFIMCLNPSKQIFTVPRLGHDHSLQIRSIITKIRHFTFRNYIVNDSFFQFLQSRNSVWNQSWTINILLRSSCPVCLLWRLVHTKISNASYIPNLFRNYNVLMLASAKTAAFILIVSLLNFW